MSTTVTTENYGKVGPLKIAQAFKEGASAKVFNASTDGKSVFVKGVKVAEKGKDGVLYLRTAGMMNPAIKRVLASLLCEITNLRNWTPHPLQKGAILFTNLNEEVLVSPKMRATIKWRKKSGRPAKGDALKAA